MDWRTHLKQYSLTSLARPYKDTADSLAYCSSLQLVSSFTDPSRKNSRFFPEGSGYETSLELQYIIHNLQNQPTHNYTRTWKSWGYRIPSCSIYCPTFQDTFTVSSVQRQTEKKVLLGSQTTGVFLTDSLYCANYSFCSIPFRSAACTSSVHGTLVAGILGTLLSIG